MVEKNEDDELSSALGAAEALMQISAGRSRRALLPAPPQIWGRRRPRSRQITLAGILRVKLEEAEAGAGGSPESPLLWNCVSSPSDDGVEVCPAKRKAEEAAAAVKEMTSCTTIVPSTMVPSTIVPSTIVPSTNVSSTMVPSTMVSSTMVPSTISSTITCTMPSTSTSLCRRVKKKKTLDELREEEGALVSSNMGLKEEIEKMQRCLAELRTTNQSLKLKLQTREEEEKRKKLEDMSDVVDHPTPKKGFLLPDLNEPFDLEMVC